MNKTFGVSQQAIVIMRLKKQRSSYLQWNISKQCSKETISPSTLNKIAETIQRIWRHFNEDELLLSSKRYLLPGCPY